MRKQRPQTWTPMTTEYQERFVPPRCQLAATPPKGTDHPLKASSTRLPTIESCHAAHKRIRSPSALPNRHRTCSSAPHKPVWLAEHQPGSDVEDYTSVYQNEFRARKADRQHLFKLTDSLQVSQGLVVPDSASAEGGNRRVSAATRVVPQVQETPFESVTSYRTDFVGYPVQPRGRRERPVYRPGRGLFSGSVGSKVTWGINQQPLDEAKDLSHRQLKTRSPDIESRGRVEESRPPAHACRCHRAKALLPSVHAGGRRREPFQATTTMKEDYKAWNTVRRLPTPVCR